MSSPTASNLTTGSLILRAQIDTYGQIMDAQKPGPLQEGTGVWVESWRNVRPSPTTGKSFVSVSMFAGPLGADGKVVKQADAPIAYCNTFASKGDKSPIEEARSFAIGVLLPCYLLKHNLSGARPDAWEKASTWPAYTQSQADAAHREVKAHVPEWIANPKGTQTVNFKTVTIKESDQMTKDNKPYVAHHYVVSTAQNAGVKKGDPGYIDSKTEAKFVEIHDGVKIGKNWVNLNPADAHEIFSKGYLDLTDVVQEDAAVVLSDVVARQGERGRVFIDGKLAVVPLAEAKTHTRTTAQELASAAVAKMESKSGPKEEAAAPASRPPWDKRTAEATTDDDEPSVSA